MPAPLREVLTSVPLQPKPIAGFYQLTTRATPDPDRRTNTTGLAPPHPAPPLSPGDASAERHQAKPSVETARRPRVDPTGGVEPKLMTTMEPEHLTTLNAPTLSQRRQVPRRFGQTPPGKKARMRAV